MYRYLGDRRHSSPRTVLPFPGTRRPKWKTVVSGARIYTGMSYIRPLEAVGVSVSASSSPAPSVPSRLSSSVRLVVPVVCRGKGVRQERDRGLPGVSSR